MNNKYFCPCCGHFYGQDDSDGHIGVDKMIRVRDNSIVLMLTCWNSDCTLNTATTTIRSLENGDLCERFECCESFDYQTGLSK